jgi:voltage-gated potassium channel
MSRVSRWRVFRTVVRAGLTTTGLVALYYVLPITDRWSGSVLARLVVGMLLFAALVGWQTRAVLRSDYPALRTLESLAAAIPLFLLVFASAYLLVADIEPGSFSEKMSKTDSLYFTVTVFATVGFGDITATIAATRIMVMVQMVADLIVIGLVVHVMLGAVKHRIQEVRSAKPAKNGP